MFATENILPIAAFGAASSAALVTARRGKGLWALVISSYCGVIAMTFTRGSMGSVLLVQAFLVMLAPLVFFARPVPPIKSAASLTLWTYSLFAVFGIGIVVGLIRHDSDWAFTMAGRFQGVAGVPLSVLMATYRFFVLATLVLAFAIPLRYHVDRALLTKVLTACWILTVVLSLAGIADYVGLANLRFDVTTATMDREAASGLHDVLLGFRRGAHGSMLVMNIFLAFALTLATGSQLIKTLVWLSAPLLLVALMLSWSRAALLATTVGVISLLITLGGRRAKWGLLMLLFAGVVFAVVMASCEEVYERMSFFRTAQVDASIEGRLGAWQGLVVYLARRPDMLITGVGFQNFSYSLMSTEKAVTLVAAHNSYLHVLAETGIIGFGVFVGWIVAVLRWLLSWRRHAAYANERAMVGSFTAAFLGLMVSALTQETLAPSPSMMSWMLHFFLILGLWASWHRCEYWSRENQGMPWLAPRV